MNTFIYHTHINTHTHNPHMCTQAHTHIHAYADIKDIKGFIELHMSVLYMQMIALFIKRSTYKDWEEDNIWNVNK